MLNKLNLDGVFHALANENRRLIIRRLSRGPTPVAELAAPLPMSLPAALQHVELLESSGLVSSEKRGRVRICRLDAEPLRLAEAWIAGRRKTWRRQRGRDVR